MVALYHDADDDGITRGTAVSMCIGDNTPVGFSVTSQGEDCDDNDEEVFQELFGFPDLDQDGLTDMGRPVCTGTSLPSHWFSLKNGTDCDDNNSMVPQFLCDDRPDLCGFVENGCPAPGTFCGPCPTEMDAGSETEKEDAGWREDETNDDVDAGDSDIENPELILDAGERDIADVPASSENNDNKGTGEPMPAEEGGCLGQQIPLGSIFPLWLWGLLVMSWGMKKKRGPRV
jgi:hypothetical protein